MTNETHLCTKCETVKSLVEFTHKGWWCDDCHRAYHAAHMRKQRLLNTEYSKRQKEAIKKYNQSPEMKEYYRQRASEYRVVNREKVRVDQKVKRILKADSCLVCSSPKNLLKHHADYSKPYDFVTVCRTCHGRIHSKYAKEYGLSNLEVKSKE